MGTYCGRRTTVTTSAHGGRQDGILQPLQGQDVKTLAGGAPYATPASAAMPVYTPGQNPGAGASPQGTGAGGA